MTSQGSSQQRHLHLKKNRKRQNQLIRKLMRKLKMQRKTMKMRRTIRTKMLQRKMGPLKKRKKANLRQRRKHRRMTKTGSGSLSKLQWT